MLFPQLLEILLESLNKNKIQKNLPLKNNKNFKHLISYTNNLFLKFLIKLTQKIIRKIIN